MTEKSWFPWETQTGTGDGQFSFDQDNSNDFFRYFDIRDPALEGVKFNMLNDLEVTGAASPLQVDSGVGISYGRYWNDAALNLVVATPVATTGGRVVLEADWSTNTIRAVVILNTLGIVAPPTITQTAGTLWHIKLASFEIDNVGVISNLVDERHYIGQATKRIFFPAQATKEGATTITDWSNTGLLVQSGIDSRQYGTGIVPDDFVGDGIMYCQGSFDDTNDYYQQVSYTYSQPASLSNGVVGNAKTIVTPPNTKMQYFSSISFPDDPSDPVPLPGDWITLNLLRWGADVLDTGGGSQFNGWVLEYTGIVL